MLLPTGVAVSVEDVEARKEDGHLEGWDYGVRASPCRGEVQVRTRVSARRGAKLGCWEWNRCRGGSALACGDGRYRVLRLSTVQTSCTGENWREWF